MSSLKEPTMQVLVSIFHPLDFKSSDEDKATMLAIDELNDEMERAGARKFAGGLKPPQEARSLRKSSDGRVVVTDGPFLETKEVLGGFWILETDSLEEAVEWGRKATVACRTPVEVRQFFGTSI